MNRRQSRHLSKIKSMQSPLQVSDLKQRNSLISPLQLFVEQ